jgi:hypothetical protein
MLKKTLLAAAVTGLVAVVAAPVQAATVVEGQMTCKEAAKMQYPADRSERRAFKKACKEAWKASQTAMAPAEEPTYAGDL